MLTERKFVLCLPNAALVCGVHPGANLALVSFGEVFWVGEWSDNTNYARRVNWASDFRQGVLRTHRTAPYLCIVQKEQLVMGEIKTGQGFFFAMHRNPLLVSSEALFQAPIIGDVLSYCSGKSNGFSKSKRVQCDINYPVSSARSCKVPPRRFCISNTDQLCTARDPGSSWSFFHSTTASCCRLYRTVCPCRRSRVLLLRMCEWREAMR